MKAVRSSCAEDEHAHARGGEEDQGEEFRGFEIFALEVRTGDQDDQDRDCAYQQVEEDAEGVQLDEAAKGRACAYGGVGVDRG